MKLLKLIISKMRRDWGGLGRGRGELAVTSIPLGGGMPRTSVGPDTWTGCCGASRTPWTVGELVWGRNIWSSTSPLQPDDRPPTWWCPKQKQKIISYMSYTTSFISLFHFWTLNVYLSFSLWILSHKVQVIALQALKTNIFPLFRLNEVHI